MVIRLILLHTSIIDITNKNKILKIKISNKDIIIKISIY